MQPYQILLSVRDSIVLGLNERYNRDRFCIYEMSHIVHLFFLGILMDGIHSLP
jgi:hypothetical protein